MIIYSTENCPKCSFLKNKLKEQNINFEECRDHEEIVKKNIFTVPTVELNDGTRLNYPQALKKLQEGLLHD